MARRTFNEEFKQSAVDLVLSQKYTRQQAAQSLGIGTTTLDYWIKQHRRRNGSATTSEPDLHKRLIELERENRRLRLERDILKKATAFFAKEPS